MAAIWPSRVLRLVSVLVQASVCLGQNLTCPPDWKIYEEGNACFSFHTGRASWAKNQRMCREKGGHLAKIPNRETENFLKGQASKVGLSTMWIGLNDRETPNSPQWHDGDKHVYRRIAAGHWASSDCAALTRYGLFVLHCNIRYGCVCQLDRMDLNVTTIGPTTMSENSTDTQLNATVADALNDEVRITDVQTIEVETIGTTTRSENSTEAQLNATVAGAVKDKGHITAAEYKEKPTTDSTEISTIIETTVSTSSSLPYTKPTLPPLPPTSPLTPAEKQQVQKSLNFLKDASSSSTQPPPTPALTPSPSSTNTSTVSNSTTSNNQKTNIQNKLCPCACNAFKFNSNPSPSALASMLNKIQQALSVQTHSLAARKNKKNSAMDDRPSSQTIAIAAIMFASIPVITIVSLDLITLYLHLYI